MYFERIIFSDGYYIERQEVIDYYRNSSVCKLTFVSGCLDILKGLSKFYTRETIRRYFECLLKQPLEGKLIDLHDTLCCFNVSDNKRKQIKTIINDFCHESDKTNSVTPESENEVLSQYRVDINEIQQKLKSIQINIGDVLKQFEMSGFTK